MGKHERKRVTLVDCKVLQLLLALFDKEKQTLSTNETKIIGAMTKIFMTANENVLEVVITRQG